MILSKRDSKFWPKWEPTQLEQNVIDSRKPEVAIRLLNKFLKKTPKELEKEKAYYQRSRVKEESDSDSDSDEEPEDDPFQYIRQMEIHQAIIRIANGEKNVPENNLH